jgi:hypothetical protein
MTGLGSNLGTCVFVSMAIAADVAEASVILAIALAAAFATGNARCSAHLAANHPISGRPLVTKGARRGKWHTRQFHTLELPQTTRAPNSRLESKQFFGGTSAIPASKKIFRILNLASCFWRAPARRMK